MAKYISLLGAPCGLGGRDQGTAQGPETLVSAGLPEYLRARGHTVHYQDLKEWTRDGGGDLSIWGSDEVSEENPKHVKRIAEANRVIAAHAFKAHLLGGLPVVLGGDHAVVMGSIAQGMVAHRKRFGLIWLDAHYDVHTHLTSTSHNANGMPFAAVMGHGHPEFLSFIRAPYLEGKDVLHVGGGNLYCEPEEFAFLKEHGIRSFPMSVIRKRIRFVCDELQAFIDAHDAIHVSCDIDVLHRRSAPGVDYPSHNGMSLSCARHLAKLLGKSGKVTSLDVVEYKPSADHWNKKGQPTTAASIMTLLGDFLGSSK